MVKKKWKQPWICSGEVAGRGGEWLRRDWKHNNKFSKVLQREMTVYKKRQLL